MLNVKRKRLTQTTLDKHFKRSRMSEMNDSGNSIMTELVEASLTGIAPSPESTSGESSTMANEAENIDLEIVIGNDDDGACSDGNTEIVKVVKPALDTRNSNAGNNDEMTHEEGYWIIFGNNSRESVEDTDHIEEHSSDTNMENNLDQQGEELKVVNPQGQDCWGIGQEVEISQEEGDEIKISLREAGGISQGEQLNEFQVRISEKDKNNSGMFLDEKTKGTSVNLQTRDENVQELGKVEIKELEDSLKTMLLKTNGAVTSREDMQVHVPETRTDVDLLQQPENAVVPSKAVDESRAVRSTKGSPVNVETVSAILQDLCKDIKTGKEDVVESSAAIPEGDKDMLQKKSFSASCKDEQDTMDMKSSAVISEREKDMQDKEASVASAEGNEDKLDKDSSALSSREELSTSSLNEDQDMLDKESSIAISEEDKDRLTMHNNGEMTHEERYWITFGNNSRESVEDTDHIEEHSSDTNMENNLDQPGGELKVLNSQGQDCWDIGQEVEISQEEGDEIKISLREAGGISQGEQLNEFQDKESSIAISEEDKDKLSKENSASCWNEDQETVDNKTSAASSKGEKDTVDRELSMAALNEIGESSITSSKGEKDWIKKELSEENVKAGDEHQVDGESSMTSSKGDKDWIKKGLSAENAKAEDEHQVDGESSMTSSKGDKDWIKTELSEENVKVEDEHQVDGESSMTSSKGHKDWIKKELSEENVKVEDEHQVDGESSMTSSKGDKDWIKKELSEENVKAEDEHSVNGELSTASSIAGAKDTGDKESAATSSKAGAKCVKKKETVKSEGTDSEEGTKDYQLLLEKEVEEQVGLRLGPDFETFLRAPNCCDSEQHNLRASHSHIVLCEYRDPSKPFPRVYSDCWDDRNVRMPCSHRSKHEVEGVGLVSRWDVIRDAFSLPIATSYDLQEAIFSYNTRNWSFKLLHVFLIEELSPEEKENFFNFTLPGIISMALSLPEVVTKPPPLLNADTDMTITMSQHQAAVLLSCAFLCMFPRRNGSNGTNHEYNQYPTINFSGLFRLDKNRPVSRKIEKLRCILHYFKRVLEKTPHGKISFRRQVMDYKCEKPRWEACCKRLCRLRVSSDGTIEDSAPGMLQVDFANERVGGGVLGSGCVQEEIRFVICPELIVARLFTEALRPNECLIVNGAERFSDYVGYGDTFKWAGNHEDQTPRDHWGRLHTEIVAIDALKVTRYTNQYSAYYMRRELNKALRSKRREVFCLVQAVEEPIHLGEALIGFHSKDIDSPQNLPAVATGNWGCGAFGGDRELKSLLQIMAASLANRDMIYFTFGDEEFAQNLFDLHSLLKGTDFRVKELWKMICKYNKVLNREPTTTVFGHIYEMLKAREHNWHGSKGN